MKSLYGEYLGELGRHNFDSLSHDEQVDYILFRNYLEHEQKQLARYEGQLAEMAALLPFAKTISDLEDSRRRLESIDAAKTAALLDELAKAIAATSTAARSTRSRPPSA